jgi:MYXO-CTERM domain-containing protein
VHRPAPTLLLAATCVAVTAAAAPPPGQSALLNGMHDIESSTFMTGATPGCDKGWITDLEYIGTSGTPGANCHDAEVAAGVSIIQRLDVSGSASFPVNTADAPGYASAFASYAAQCPNLHVWIVGNEPNFTTNNSDPATYASPYAEAYAQVHAKLHAVAGHANDLVLVAPASPYSPFCICSMHQIIQQIRSRGVTPDGFAVHAYTQAQTPSDYGTLPSLVTSEQMSQSNDGCGYPFHWQFRIYRDWIGAIEGEGLTGAPVLVTETGNACAPQKGNACYPDSNIGYFQALYGEVAAWNADPSHPTKIRALTPYRWTINDDGTGRDFAIGTRTQLQTDLTAAFAKKYAWTPPCGGSTCADDDGCGGATICDFSATKSCGATTPCGPGGQCAAGEVCREGTLDCVPAPRGAATITFVPAAPAPNTTVTIDVSATTGYTNVGLDLERVGGAKIATTLSSIQSGKPIHWIYTATLGGAGTYRATFRADPAASTVYAIGYVDVGAIDFGPGDAGPSVDGGQDAGADGGTEPGSPGGCSCGVAATGTDGAAFLALAAVAAAVARRRSGSRTRTSRR